MFYENFIFVAEHHFESFAEIFTRFTQNRLLFTKNIEHKPEIETISKLVKCTQSLCDKTLLHMTFQVSFSSQFATNFNVQVSQGSAATNLTCDGQY